MKYLISFLLIFGLTVNEVSLYSANDHQVSYFNTRNQISHKHSESYVYGKETLSRKVFITPIKYCLLQNIYSTQIKTTIKLRTELYQTINLIIVQSVFLIKIITSSNQNSSLYIA